MNRYILTLLLVLISITSSRAELLVYRESERGRITGSGVEVTITLTTFWVYDTVTKQIDSIGFFKAGPNRYYTITNSTGFLVRQGIQGRTGNYTVLARSAISNDA